METTKERVDSSRLEKDIIDCIEEFNIGQIIDSKAFAQGMITEMDKLGIETLSKDKITAIIAAIFQQALFNR